MRMIEIQVSGRLGFEERGLRCDEAVGHEGPHGYTEPRQGSQFSNPRFWWKREES